MDFSSKTSLIFAALLAISACSAAASPPFDGWIYQKAETSSGRSLCTLGSSPKSGEVIKNLVIKKIDGVNHLNVTLYKDTWNIPKGKTIVTTIDFMDNKPLTLDSYGDGKIVDIAIPEQDTFVFISLLNESSFLQVGFPKGSEPTWTVPLSGISPELKRFVGCALSAAEQAKKKNTQPF